MQTAQKLLVIITLLVIIYILYYTSPYINLVLNNSAMIKQYKNCSKYSTANKSNKCYYNNIYYPKQTCKDIGNQLLPKRKETKKTFMLV